MSKESKFSVCWDHQRRTCIKVNETAKGVEYIPLAISDGLEVKTCTKKEFDGFYKPIKDYPIQRACQLYAGYARTIGATEEAVKYLKQVVNLTDQEIENMVAKASVEEPIVVKKKVATKKVAAKKESVEKESVEKEPVEKEPAAKVKKAPSKKTSTPESYSSAAQMFQGLIMSGELSDDDIFKEVQEAFGLDDSKRGYVKWYRNNLSKKGLNPPDAK